MTLTGFTYDPSIGEFILTHENIKLPAKSKCYSINEAYQSYWDKGVVGFVDWIKTPNKVSHFFLPLYDLELIRGRRRKADLTLAATSAVWSLISTATCCTEVSTPILAVSQVLLRVANQPLFLTRPSLDKREPNGKLRLLYECAPLSFICERAGGLVSARTSLR